MNCDALRAQWLPKVARGEAMPPGAERYPCVEVRCHSFVTDGRIQFLSDSTHVLAGQTVDLPPIADSMGDD